MAVSPRQQQTDAGRKLPVLFIHDAAIDDFIATMLLVAMPNVDLKGIVITDADCVPQPGIDAANRLQLFIGRSDIPLALSELRGWNPFPWPYRDDCVKFNALPILRPYHSTVPTPPPSGNQLIAALLEQAVKSDIKLTVLLTTGFTPLTDVLRARNELIAGIDRIVWMGGAINVPGNLDPKTIDPTVVNRHAEWNVFWDPFAAQDGLDMFSGIHDFPLDITNTVPITKEFMATLKAQGEQYTFSQLAYDAYSIVSDEPFYDMWDVCATVFIARPDLYAPPEKLRFRRRAMGLRAGLAVHHAGRQERAERLSQLRRPARLLRLLRRAACALGVTRLTAVAAANAGRPLPWEDRMNWPHRFLAIAALVATTVGLVATLYPQDGNAQSAAKPAFQSAVKGPPPGWKGPVFKLSADYPKEVPGTCAECTWLKLDVNFRPTFDPEKLKQNTWKSGQWDQYLQRILDYVKQSQDTQFANDPGFKIKVNGKTRWFSVPWMAYDPTVGREFVHGTTNERTAHLRDLIHPSGGTKKTLHGANMLLGETQACIDKYPNGFETWAVGYYNEWGGMAMGKAIPKSGKPHIVTYMGSPMPAGLPFPQYTVVVKFLTTTAPEECVPYLKGSPAWQIDRHVQDPKTQAYTCAHKVQISHIIQVDVAVTDPRSPTGWVYGTYAYDGNRPGSTFWDKLDPLGIEFGSDPWTFPAVPKSAGLPAQQSVINPNIGIYQHLGCEDRLAGPVDNSQSSCLACHGSAYAAPGGAPTQMASTCRRRSVSTACARSSRSPTRPTSTTRRRRRASPAATIPPRSRSTPRCSSKSRCSNTASSTLTRRRRPARSANRRGTRNCGRRGIT